jgi:hypothetical protein
MKRLWLSQRDSNTWMSIDGGAVLIHVLAPGHLETTDIELAYADETKSNVQVHEGENGTITGTTAATATGVISLFSE